MPARDRHRYHPVLDGLETRLPLSGASAVPLEVSGAALAAVKADRDRAFTPADLSAYAKAYDSYIGQPAYIAAYDFNGTGYIGQNDAIPIVQGLRGITPKIPFRIEMNLAPHQQIQGNHSKNSGGDTYKGAVTVIGHTTPNSIIFYDKTVAFVAGNYKFTGGATTSNAQGVFYVSYKVGVGLTNTDYLIVTPFGQRMIHDFPIVRTPTFKSTG